VTDRQDPSKHSPAEPKDPFDREWFKIQGAVLRILRARLESKDEAREALNEVYVQMRDRWYTTTILDVHLYARRMAENIAAERIRKLKVRKRFVDRQSASRSDTDEKTPEHLYDEQQEERQLQLKLEQLPADLQDIFKALLEGRTAQWIAEHFGLERRTVYRRIKAIRKWVSQKLGLARGRKP
jgi:RNA polymerase sigma factor (sigma-70 family)